MPEDVRTAKSCQMRLELSLDKRKIRMLALNSESHVAGRVEDMPTDDLHLSESESVLIMSADGYRSIVVTSEQIYSVVLAHDRFDVTIISPPPLPKTAVPYEIYQSPRSFAVRYKTQQIVIWKFEDDLTPQRLDRVVTAQNKALIDLSDDTLVMCVRLSQGMQMKVYDPYSGKDRVVSGARGPIRLDVQDVSRISVANVGDMLALLDGHSTLHVLSLTDPSIVKPVASNVTCFDWSPVHPALVYIARGETRLSVAPLSALVDPDLVPLVSVVLDTGVDTSIQTTIEHVGEHDTLTHTPSTGFGLASMPFAVTPLHKAVRGDPADLLRAAYSLEAFGRDVLSKGFNRKMLWAVVATYAVDRGHVQAAITAYGELELYSKVVYLQYLQKESEGNARRLADMLHQFRTT